MASYSVNVAKHATAAAAVNDDVTFAYRGDTLRVANRGGTNELYFRFDGTAATALGDDNYMVSPGTSVVMAKSENISVVSVISTGGTAYTVEVY